MSRKLSAEDAGRLLAQVAPNISVPVTLEEASHRAAANLTSDYRELVSVLPDDWATRLFSWLRVNGPSGENTIREPNSFLLQGWMETGLLALLENGVLKPVIETPESNHDIESLRKSVNYHDLLPKPEADDETSATAAELTGPTEEELDAQIINDWQTLPTSEIHSKCRVADYKARLYRLLNENRVGR